MSGTGLRNLSLAVLVALTAYVAWSGGAGWRNASEASSLPVGDRRSVARRSWPSRAPWGFGARRSCS